MRSGTIDRVTDLEIVEDGTDQNMVAAWNSESGDNIGGTLRSTDNGVSWFDSSTGLPASSDILVMRFAYISAKPFCIRLS